MVKNASNVSAPFNVSQKYPNLILPRWVPIHFFVNDIDAAIEVGYTKSFQELKPILGSYHKERFGESLLGAYLGILQNPGITPKQIKKLWAQESSTSIAQELWLAGIPWSEPVLEFLINDFLKTSEGYDMSGFRTLLEAIAAYRYWDWSNCHILERVCNNKYILLGLQKNPTISEDILVIANLVAG